VTTANLVEAFSSVQGEGPYVGASTFFVRFGACDLRCAWCDSPHTWLPSARCRIERAPGTARFRELDNPVPCDVVVETLDAFATAGARHRFASLTGGEPLLQAQAVAELAPRLRERGPRIHLETHGLSVDALEQVVEHIDVVSMDWKLTSDVRRAADPKHGPVAPFHATHEKFLATAAARSEVYVKVVLTPHTEDAELDAVCDGIRAVASQTTLVLQPVTPFARVQETPPPERLLACLRRCEARLADVRLIPQTHRVYAAL
jgi:7-carboxy-7-deazaguanine synthase